MSSIQIADQTFVAASRDAAVAVVGDKGNWRRWWPDLALTVTEDRGIDGIRWRVGGPLTGTMEIWMDARLDGFVLHYFLHAEPGMELPAGGRARCNRLASLTRTRRAAGRNAAFDVKDRLESRRQAGEPAVVAPAVSVRV